MGTRFVDIPADALLAELRSIAEAVRGKGGRVEEGIRGREVVFDISPPGSPAFVRIYTSLASGEDAVRDCGEDAVRLVLGWFVLAEGCQMFRSLGEQRRIYRTAPKGDAEERVAVFLKRLRDAIREFYRMALGVPICLTPGCGAPMASRESRDGRRFLGCGRYPTCRGTRSA